MRKVLIATGGTGGHLFPAQQLAEQLLDCDVAFAGHKLDSSPFFQKTKTYFEVDSAASLKNAFTLFKGFLQSLKVIWKYQPNVVVGFGSFHTFPVLLAALFFRKKIVLFEPNYTLGKVNRFFSFFADKIAFQFPVPHKKAAYVPLLPWKEQAPPVYRKNLKNREFDEVNPTPYKTILVFGGSQGAAFINKTFCEAAKLLRFPFRVIHFTGKEDPTISYSAPALIKPFEKDMPSVYVKADFAVCRCGANTTAELIRYNLPAVLIPYPYAHDHQKENGKFLKDAVLMLDQAKTTPESLARAIESLNENLEKHREAFRRISFPKTVPFASLLF